MFNHFIKPAVFLSVFLLTGGKTFAQTSHLLIGTYTNKGNSEGIYTYAYNTQSGAAKLVDVAKNIENPSYLTLSPDKKFVYSVNETGENSTISAFAYQNGKLTFLNKQNAEGADPCYLITDGNNVLTANYSGGTIAVFGIQPNGRLSPAKQIIKHTGKGTDPKNRQQSAHVHMVRFSLDKKFVLVTDLGEDKLYVYHYNAHTPQQTLSLKKVYASPPISGPRHLTLSPNGKYVYLVHEFTGHIAVYRFLKGRLTKIQEIATTDKDFKGNIDGADIHVSADGKYLYETNRGDANTISVFKILQTGLLHKVQTLSTLGKGPRNFAIDPSGKHLLVAHQYTNQVVIFNRNALTGKLSDSGQRIKVGTPVCLMFDK